MALIEVYLYPFDSKKVNIVAVIKYYRHINDVGLAETVKELKKIRLDARNNDIFVGGSTELLFYSGNDISKGLSAYRELQLLGCDAEILHNGNRKTLELLYGK